MRLVLLPCLALLATGCALSTSTPPSVASGHATTSAAVAGAPSTGRAAHRAAPTTALASEIADRREVGDYVVHRFSGTFRKHALVLAERVVKKAGPIIIIDYMLTEERGTKLEPGMHLRVTFDKTPGARREIAKVERVLGERAEPGTLEDYEKLMAETMVVPDRNDGQLASEIGKARVGEATVDCKKTSYRVALGGKRATLSTCESDTFAWGDLAGEIKSDGGRVIYRAEIVETGSAGGRATKAASR